MKKYLYILISIIILAASAVCFFVFKNRPQLVVCKDKPLDNSVNMVFITDSGYVFPTKVAIRSTIKNKDENTVYGIYIIGGNLSKNEVSSLEKLSSENAKVKVINEVGNIGLYKDFKLDPVYKSITAATEVNFYKFDIPRIFPDFDKMIYLDSDILVLKDLSELYNIDIKEVYAAAVHTYTMKSIKYFNSGVMLLNLKKMRKDRVSQKLISMRKKQTNTSQLTESTMNELFRLKVKWISPKYNYNIFQVMTYNPSFTTIKDPTIVHFTKYKPWWIKGLKYQDEWLKYLTEDEKKHLDLQPIFLPSNTF